MIFPNKHQVLKTVHEACLLRPLGSVLFWLAVKWPFVNSHLSDIHSSVPGRALSLLPRGRSYSNFHVENHRTGAGSAFFGSDSVCTDKGKKMIKIHCPSFVFTNPEKRSPAAAAKFHSGSGDLLITISRMSAACGEIKIPAWLTYEPHSQFVRFFHICRIFVEMKENNNQKTDFMHIKSWFNEWRLVYSTLGTWLQP